MNSTLQQPPNRLEGRTALVTGRTRRLGRSIAEWLAREGADVIITGETLLVTGGNESKLWEAR